MKKWGERGMFEQGACWHEFYRELDPGRRRRMLEELFRAEPDDGANRYRLMLLEARHGGAKKDGAEVDRFLFQFVNLVQVYRSGKLFRKNARRETEKLMRELLWTEAAQYGEAGERALYWELRNAAMRYFKTCEGSLYNRGLFGLVPSGDADRKDRVSREVWQMTEGLCGITGLEAELTLWNRAVADAYCQFDDKGSDRLAKYR